jgi:DNA-binding NarL/FixJ family response regulator
MTVVDSPPMAESWTAVVAASPLVRLGLEHILAAAPGVLVRHSVESVTTLPSGTGAPSLVVLAPPHRPGRRIDARYWALLPPGCRVIVLCGPGDALDLLAALRGGVHALLSLEADIDELHTAVDTVRRGGLYISGALFASVIDRDGTADPPQRLGRREIETLRFVAAGLTHRQISRRMGLTESSVNTYVKRIRSKLNVGNKAELTRRAIELGYLDPGPEDEDRCAFVPDGVKACCAASPHPGSGRH